MLTSGICESCLWSLRLVATPSVVFRIEQLDHHFKMFCNGPTKLTYILSTERELVNNGPDHPWICDKRFTENI